MQIRRRMAPGLLLVTSLAAAFTLVLAFGSLPASAQADMDHGHVLISDQFNNRVIEVDIQTHKVVWVFGNGSSKAGPHSVVGVNDAQRVGHFTLISGTGIPPSNPALPGCPDAVNGCADNRVFFVNWSGDIVWQYGQAGVTGSGPNQLNAPVQALFTTTFRGKLGFFVLITDQGNQRIIVVDLNGQIVWQYGTTGVAGNGTNQLSSPNSGEVLPNGNILIADEGNNRVIEVKPNGALVQTFTAGGTLGATAFASRLPDGDTLISDAGNNRIVEVDANDSVVWQYATNTGAGTNPNPQPTRGVRLENGNTLISDQFNDRVIEVTPEGRIVWTQGKINVPSAGFDRLNGPYDAKKIGDYTGLTPPVDFVGDDDE